MITNVSESASWLETLKPCSEREGWMGEDDSEMIKMYTGRSDLRAFWACCQLSKKLHHEKL